ncbi:Ion_trans_2 domain-containing protein [Cephalotus follicularis]|uniref:Ion_trans_2 domain-containing protein n=1 Tax=Cephalotus follicularis TaxID=3775 RepID=A0A1Q3AVV3_CEPFO|nr:Ion_trans_2 domain-containing protein [Cephalotus follicularis]
MAQEEAIPLLLSDMEGPSPKISLQRRRHRHCGIAPSTDTESPKENRAQSLLCLESIYDKQKFSFKLVLILLSAYLSVGTLSFFLIRNQIEGKKTNGVLDALYFCVVTMTTVGYGDLVPGSVLSKLLACIYVFSGMALGGLILGKAADYILEKQEILLVKAMHMRERVGPEEIVKEAENHRVQYKFFMAASLLLVLMIVGTLFLTLVENLTLIDAFYCVCSTITTLGYGDESFSTIVGRIFAVFWILSSTLCLGQCFLYLAELYTERRKSSLVKWVLTRRMTCSDLEAADLDHDKSVSAAEFIIYTLKEMGNISQEDISLVMERFKKLDVDRSGTLTASDLLCQSS